MTPEFTLREPVAEVPGVPSKYRSDYQAPGGTSVDAELWANQCWTNARKTQKTAGTQGPDGVCIWNNGSLASMGHGGAPGTPYQPGLYVSIWFGIETPLLDLTDEHDLLHPHFREE